MKISLKILLASIFVVAGVSLMLSAPYYIGYTNERQAIGAFLPQAWSMEQWQHCWIVLPASLFIVYQDRSILMDAVGRGSWSGLLGIFFSLTLFYIGFRVDNIYFGYAAIQFFIPSVILWLVGWQMLWRLAFSIIFLAFAWPMFFLEEKITFPLRVIMSNASALVLNILGVDVIRQGTGLISAPDPVLGIPAGARFSVDVADPCSGIRSLFALMMVSALYGHFTFKSIWKKWCLFFCSIPLAVLGNLVRILVLTFGTIAFGSEFAIGRHALTDPSWFHMGAGYLVFVVALLGMLGVGWFFNHWQSIPEFFSAFVRFILTRHAQQIRTSVIRPESKGENHVENFQNPVRSSYRDEY